MVRFKVSFIAAYFFVIGIIPCGARQPDIQQKEISDPCWGFDGDAYIRCVDSLTGSTGTTPPSTSCGTLCPRPCTYWFNTPLYNGDCHAPIELCNGTVQNAICQCNGMGSAPTVYWGTKHLTYQ